MKTIDFSLDAVKNGGKITAFNYSHSLNELVGSWNASAAGGTFKAGETINFDGVIKDGIITSAYKDSDGLWHIEGKDAGVKLMKSTPDVSELPEGSAKTVIQYLADFCNITLSMQDNGLKGFNVRSVISGSTCVEAILELAMFSGFIAYIDSRGRLVVKPPSKNTPTFEDVIDDSGSNIDLDGYATQVLVTLNRRKWADTQEQDDDTGETIYIGETPSRTPERVTKSGTFSNGSYSITTLEPFGVMVKSETSITENGINISTVEEHDYDYKSKVIWREDQEYVLFAFIETGYNLTRTAEGQYNGVLEYSVGDNTHVTAINPIFSEVTTETMTRSMSASDAVIGVPDDWQGDIKLVGSETITRSTVRTGDVTPDENMPPYAPPFDSQIIRSYTREDRGKALLCNETETTYEARQVGSIAPVRIDGNNIPHFLRNSNLAIQTHSTPEWVQVKTSRTYFEQYDNEGQCIFSTRSEYSDDGADWLLSNGFSDTGDNDLNAYEAAYAAFSQQSKGLSVSLDSSNISSAWQFLELQGRMKSKVTSSDIQAALGNISDWYDNGQYVRQSVCPHYNSYTKACNVYLLDESDSPSPVCSRSKGTRFWMWCPRALVALDLAREQDTSQVEVPVIGSASITTPITHAVPLDDISAGNSDSSSTLSPGDTISGSTSGSSSKNPSVGYQRDIYIDELLDNDTAQNIADTIAGNILTIKGIKGFRKTITVPYNADFQPDGVILEVSHDWENLTTSVTYKDEGDIPECLISQSVASIAAFVSARDTARLNVPKYGVVLDVSSGYASVRVGSSTVSCTTKLTNLAQDDIVLVAFPAGNKVRGQVIARL